MQTGVASVETVSNPLSLLLPACASLAKVLIHEFSEGSSTASLQYAIRYANLIIIAERTLPPQLYPSLYDHVQILEGDLTRMFSSFQYPLTSERPVSFWLQLSTF